MAAIFITVISYAVHVCSGSHSLNNEIKYLKSYVIDRSYHLFLNSALRKLKHSRMTNSNCFPI